MCIGQSLGFLKRIFREFFSLIINDWIQFELTLIQLNYGHKTVFWTDFFLNFFINKS